MWVSCVTSSFNNLSAVEHDLLRAENNALRARLAELNDQVRVMSGRDRRRGEAVEPGTPQPQRSGREEADIVPVGRCSAQSRSRRRL